MSAKKKPAADKASEKTTNENPDANAGASPDDAAAATPMALEAVPAAAVAAGDLDPGEGVVPASVVNDAVAEAQRRVEEAESKAAAAEAQAAKIEVAMAEAVAQATEDGAQNVLNQVSTVENAAEIQAEFDRIRSELAEQEERLKLEKERVDIAAALGVATGDLPEEIRLTGGAPTWWSIAYPGCPPRVVPRPQQIRKGLAALPRSFPEAQSHYHKMMGIRSTTAKPKVEELTAESAVTQMLQEPAASGRPEVNEIEGRPGWYHVSAPNCEDLDVEAPNEVAATLQFLEKVFGDTLPNSAASEPEPARA